jgi:hypothetical protein
VGKRISRLPSDAQPVGINSFSYSADTDSNPRLFDVNSKWYGADKKLTTSHDLDLHDYDRHRNHSCSLYYYGIWDSLFGANDLTVPITGWRSSMYYIQTLRLGGAVGGSG